MLQDKGPDNRLGLYAMVDTAMSLIFALRNCHPLLISLSHLFFSISLTTLAPNLVANAASTSEDPVLLTSGEISVTTQDLQRDLTLLAEARRNWVLSASENLKEFLQEIYTGKRMMAEAEQLGLDRTFLFQARLAAERRRLLAESLGEHLRQQIKETDFTALAREHYAAHPDQFQIPEQFRVAHILKHVSCDCEKPEKRQKIESILGKLKTGEDFSTLAKTESDDKESATQGGDLGKWMKKIDLVAPFADAMSKLEPGQLSEVIETQFGFHIIKLLERQPARVQPFEEARQALEERLKQDYAKTQLQQRVVKRYQPDKEVTFNEQALQSLLDQTRAR